MRRKRVGVCGSVVEETVTGTVVVVVVDVVVTEARVSAASASN